MLLCPSPGAGECRAQGYLIYRAELRDIWVIVQSRAPTQGYLVYRAELSLPQGYLGYSAEFSPRDIWLIGQNSLPQGYLGYSALMKTLCSCFVQHSQQGRAGVLLLLIWALGVLSLALKFLAQDCFGPESSLMKWVWCALCAPVPHRASPDKMTNSMCLPLEQIVAEGCQKHNK